MNRIWYIMTSILLTAGTLPLSAETPATAPSVIRVAIYDDGGGSSIGPDNVEKCLSTSKEFQFRRITAEDIRKGTLKDTDVLVQPGGSGSKQAAALGDDGCRAIKDFVGAGGGYVGICAGAYLASSEYTWSLGIMNSRVVDRAHWARGKGVVKIRWTDAGRNLLGATDEISSVDYNQGPLLGPAKKPEPAPYQELATFETEIAEKGAPAGVMKGTTAIASGTFQSGRVICISPHPERSAGLDGTIRRAVQWVGKRLPENSN